MSNEIYIAIFIYVGDVKHHKCFIHGSTRQAVQWMHDAGKSANKGVDHLWASVAITSAAERWL